MAHFVNAMKPWFLKLGFDMVLSVKSPGYLTMYSVFISKAKRRGFVAKVQFEAIDTYNFFQEFEQRIFAFFKPLFFLPIRIITSKYNLL